MHDSVIKDPCFVDRNRFFNFEAPFPNADFQIQKTGPPFSLENDTVTPAVHPRIRPGKNEWCWFTEDVLGSACASVCLVCV